MTATAHHPHAAPAAPQSPAQRQANLKWRQERRDILADPLREFSLRRPPRTRALNVALGAAFVAGVFLSLLALILAWVVLIDRLAGWLP